MPRRSTSDPLALLVGTRIRQLREEAGLTIERLAYESDVGSKGHLSSIERGLVRPTVNTLHALAQALDVLVLDLVTFPDADDRQELVDLTRMIPSPQLKALLRSARAEVRRPAVAADEAPSRYNRRR